MQGWVKLHRSIMKSDTFSRLTAIQKLITIYIIMNANHEDGIWYDKYRNVEVPVKRGELIISRNKVVNDWFSGDKDVTEQKFRTCLKKLEKFGFLTSTSTKHYTVLKVHNYGIYQGIGEESNQQNNHEPTNSQPTTNQQLTTNKNDKNDKNEEEVKKKRRQPKVYDEDSVHFKLANYLYQKILENNPKVKKPNLQTWADKVRLMMSEDKRTEEDIAIVIDWCQRNEFWKTIVLSTENLRKKFDTLYGQYLQSAKKKGVVNGEVNQSDAEWYEKYGDRLNF